MMDITSKFNILMAHVGVAAKSLIFCRNQFDEQVVKLDEIDGFDYVALGHYHGHIDVAENMWYSGSVESLSFMEAEDEKGFIVLDVDGKNFKREFVSVDYRPMIDLPIIDCDELDLGIDNLTKLIVDIMDGIDLEERIVRLRVDGIPMNVYNTMDFRRIKDMTKGCLAFKPIYNVVRDEFDIKEGSSHFKNIQEEWREFMGDAKVDKNLDRSRVVDMGMKYLSGDNK